MDNRKFAQISYNPDDPDDVTVMEVPNKSMDFSNSDECIEEQREEVQIKNVDEQITLQKEIRQESLATDTSEQIYQADAAEEIPLHEKEPIISGESDMKPDMPQTTQTENDGESVNCDDGEGIEESEGKVQEIVRTKEQQQEPIENIPIPGGMTQLIAGVNDEIVNIQRTMRRIDKKFDDEILNAENRDSTVKTIYKELNEYKTGLVEKALKNVLYDIVDIREMMLSQIRFLSEKQGLDSISLDEFSSYADDIGDILEKHDVLIYKGDPGEENEAVRQKIVRKVETEDETLVKRVAESLSYGYEYNSKILYPERISVYVKKK